VAVVGTLTALLAATIALVQRDIKKVLAYSTVSQLGYMFLGLGVGATGAAVFHLVTHAFFKALLFLGAGSVIHGLGGEQDLMRMGGLRAKMPVTFATVAVATLAIAGVFPFSGFFSKDEILWAAVGGEQAAPVLGVLGLVVAFMTAFYTGRLFLLAFFGECRASAEVRHHLHESPPVMTGPLVVLAILSAVGGFIPIPAIVAAATGHAHEAHAPIAFQLFATALALGGLGLAYLLYVARPELPGELAGRLSGLYRLALDKFRVDELYGATVVRPIFAVAELGAERLDPAVIDGAVNGTGTVMAAASRVWRRLQTGNVQHYALSFLVGVLLLVGWYAAR
jgi:NADH-quinone oxidoreductase subunit L